MDTHTPPRPLAEPASLGEYNGFELYPMPFFVTLAVEAPAEVAAWYAQALGFGVMFAGPVVHLRRRKYQDLLLVQAGPAAPPTAGGPALRFDADGELEALAERVRAAAPVGRAQVEGPVDTPWNTTELRVTDPAGHVLVFHARRANPDPAQEARWRAAFAAGRKPSSASCRSEA
jgi:uncharacterized glyoxalase superfamily protein PhnB